MSIYSDYKVGALSDEEFKSLCIHENEKERYYDLLIEKQEYHTDDDVEEEGEDE